MKRFYVLVTLGLFSLAAAQKLIVYRDNLKNPHVIIQWTQGFLAPGENFELNGNVQFKRIETDGKAETVMSCSKASGNLVKLKNKTEFDKVERRIKNVSRAAGRAESAYFLKRAESFDGD